MYYKLYRAMEDRLFYVWDQLGKHLSKNYEEVRSCNNDKSRYLVPKGTKDQITYYGKPAYSFRISDHWSWYANLNKCNDPYYIQCNSIGLRPNPRLEEGKASEPIKALQICCCGPEGIYYPIMGVLNDMSKNEVYFKDMNVGEFVKTIEKYFLERYGIRIWEL